MFYTISPRELYSRTTPAMEKTKSELGRKPFRKHIYKRMKLENLSCLFNLKRIENDRCSRINLCRNQQRRKEAEEEEEEENQSCNRAPITANMNKADINLLLNHRRQLLSQFKKSTNPDEEKSEPCCSKVEREKTVNKPAD